MDSQCTDSKSSENSETGSQIVIISKPYKNCNEKLICNDTVEDPYNGNLPIDDYLDRQERVSFVLRTPRSKAIAQNFLDDDQVSQERNEILINSTSNHTSNTRTNSSSFHSAIRLPMAQVGPQLVVETKHDGDNSTSLLTFEEQHGVRLETHSNSGNSCPLPDIEGPGVLGLKSRLASLIRSRSLDSLDEEYLNNFNLEVASVSSRVDMWRQRLEDERTHSVRSHSHSEDIGSAPRSASYMQVHSVIADEIHNLIQLIRDLMHLLFGRFSWGLLGMEDRLIALLERGSHLVSPAAETLLMSIWRMLRKLLDLNEDDREKSSRVHSVAEVINDAFYAIRSLVHLGKAYRNAHESSDSEYTKEDSRSLLGGSNVRVVKKP